MNEAKTAEPAVRPDAAAEEATPRDPEMPPTGIRLSPYLLALGPDAVSQVVHRFLDNVDDLVRAMDDAVEHRDAADLERAAHSLKGSSGTIGAARLRELCRRLEDHAERGLTAGAQGQLAEIRREHRRIRHDLRHIPPPRRPEDDAA